MESFNREYDRVILQASVHKPAYNILQESLIMMMMIIMIMTTTTATTTTTTTTTITTMMMVMMSNVGDVTDDVTVNGIGEPWT